MTQERQLLFGTGGVPRSSKGKSTAAGIQRIAELGLGCMEVEFSHGANMTEQMAEEVGALAKSLNVKLTVHAPYFINLNAREHKKVIESQTRLIQTAHIASLMEAESVIFHPAYYLKDHPEDVYAKVKKVQVDTVK
jgi:deoxyribonuclease-4